MAEQLMIANANALLGVGDPPAAALPVGYGEQHSALIAGAGAGANAIASAAQEARAARDESRATRVAVEAIGAQVSTLVEAAARQQEAADRVQASVEGVAAQGTSIIGKIDRLARVTDNIHGITRNIATGVRNIRGRIGRGDPSLFRSMLLNEWFVLIVIFLTHPYLPITAETIGSLWVWVLSVSFSIRTARTLIIDQEIPIIHNGGPVRWAFRIALCAPHAIYLLDYLTQEWTRVRTGGGANIFRTTTLEPGIQYLFAHGMQDMIQRFRTFIEESRTVFPEMRPANETLPFTRPRNSFGINRNRFTTATNVRFETHTSAEYVQHINQILARFPGLWDRIQATISRAFGDMRADPPVFIQMLGNYLRGQLYIIGEDGARRFLTAPAYIQQLGDLRDGELRLWTWITWMFMSYVYSSLQHVIPTIYGMLCGLACRIRQAAHTAANNPENSWGASAFLSAMATMADLLAAPCNCPPLAGGSRTRRRKRVNKKIRANRKTKYRQRGGELSVKKTAEIIQISYEALQLYTAHFFSDGKVTVDPAILKELDEKGSAMIESTGQYKPIVDFKLNTSEFTKLLDQ